MKALLVAREGRHYEHQRDAMLALQLGMARHGIETRVKPSPSSPRTDDDFIVTWGDKITPRPNGTPHLILECGYINGTGTNYTKNRMRFISTSWNKRHGLSDWNWSGGLNGERWDALGIEIQPWFPDGEYVLLIEQHIGDRAAPDVGKFRGQVKEKCALRKWPIRVRPHPSYYRNERTLAEDLSDALFAVTWCSSAAVEAVIAGVPTYTLGPGSIAAPVTRSALWDTPYTGDRLPWAHRLAYRQWSMAELEDGSAWPHIQSGLP